MTFKEWVSKIVVGDDHSVYDGIMDGDYAKRRDVLGLVEEAFEAGYKAGIDAVWDNLEGRTDDV